MSYILEALRKSDKQRQRGTAPTLLTAQATVATPNPPATLRYVLLGVALLGAGIAIGWLRPWQPEPPAPATAPPAAAKLPQPSARQTAPAPLPASPETAATREPESTPAAPTAPMPTSALIKEEDLPAPARTPAHRAPPKAVAAVPKKAETPVPQKPGRASAMPEQPVMTLAELPVQIQQEIPDMSIAVHAYSSQAKNRLVSINDRLLHEGMSLAPGLKLEEITPDGMIFSYKGYRFSRRAPGAGAPAEAR